jgi:ATP-dependent DNA helicase RecG
MERLPALLKSGVIERVARKYILSRKFYEFVNKKGVYTRKRGLDRETNKQLLLKHIRDNRKEGSRLQDLMQVLPALSRRQVQALLAELKNRNEVRMIGKTSAAKWYPCVKDARLNDGN